MKQEYARIYSLIIALFISLTTFAFENGFTTSDAITTNSDNYQSDVSTPTPPVKRGGKTIDGSEVLKSFKKYVNSIDYYSEMSALSANEDISAFINDLNALRDQDDKEDYIREHTLNGFLIDAKKALAAHKDSTELLIQDYLNANYSRVTINDKQVCLDEMSKYLADRLAEREALLDKLSQTMRNNETSSATNSLFNDKSLISNMVIAVGAALLLIGVIFSLRRKKTGKKPTVIPYNPTPQQAQNDIIVRRKTTSILKRQSLEDVQNNPAYLKIDCADFCEDSAVRRIYFKNSCIRDIYEMYAEDLRNSERPNEDGCMVLGRWVHDSENDEYYVSLEEIIKPGDDAIFQEYELNFGGKIKLKVADRLRKLRKDTNLQYDMTCWVHSHPGLTVFFSNADSSVQMQLKHPTHPKFLTAIVVDILTPNQQMGIFTFKNDLTINSKSDLKKMYSLIELNQWALDSEKDTMTLDNYYEIVKNAKEKSEDCHAVNLSDGAITDMCQLVIEQQTGLVAWIHGNAFKNGDFQKFTVSSVVTAEVIPDNTNLGCFIIGAHRSLPTIRKAIAEKADTLKFVLFYSNTESLLTFIPVINGQLSIDENYYSELKFEDLKIWTRRKR